MRLDADVFVPLVYLICTVVTPDKDVIAFPAGRRKAVGPRGPTADFIEEESAIGGGSLDRIIHGGHPVGID